MSDLEPEQIRTSAEFVISGVDVGPEAITAALGIEPDAVQRIGDEIKDRHGTLVGTKRINRWTLSSRHRCASAELTDHLRVLLDIVFLEPTR